MHTLMHLLTFASMVMMLAFYSEPAQKVIAGPKPKFDKNSRVLEGRCAVIVRPDNKKIELMRKQSSESDYNTVVSDNEYYMGLAVDFLNSTKINQIAKPAHGVLTFRSSTGRYFKVSLAPFNWSIILFNGRAKPIEADITDFEANYRAYMKK
jgi:hypothetical protein